LKPAQPKKGKLRIHQSLARDLGIAILSGKFKPGENLSGEIERARELGVSRNTYREAIRILIAKGMIESRPKAGTRVTGRETWNLLDPEVLEWTFTGDPDHEFIHELFEMRYIIEPAAAFLAAERRSDEQAREMRSMLDIMRKSGLASDEGSEADTQFHNLLLKAAGNAGLATLSSSISAAVLWTTRFKLEHNAKPRNSIPDHEAVLEAIEARNAQAALENMRSLLFNARQDMNIPFPAKATSLAWAKP